MRSHKIVCVCVCVCVFLKCFYIHFNFFYIKPYTGPKGLKLVVYMKIHSCVGWYATVYLILSANDDGRVMIDSMCEI